MTDKTIPQLYQELAAVEGELTAAVENADQAEDAAAKARAVVKDRRQERSRLTDQIRALKARKKPVPTAVGNADPTMPAALRRA